MAGRFLSISPRVKHALVHQQPLVFLESAIITHGLPSSHSSVPLSLERIVEGHGAVPSTVGILDGVIRVGLSPQEIERLANEEGREKAGVREIPAFVAQRKTAGLTVSGTMEVMRLAGHQGVFVTGGIGGVHRGASSTFDISSDLPTLARIPGMVVCSGPKSILDIPLTLEYLETLGVLVSTYRSTKFPAFYTSDSGCKSPLSFESFQEAARALWILNSTDRGSGMLLANPIPQKFEDRGLRIQKIVEETVKKAEEEGIHKLGKAVTPWILERVARETKGESIENNIALIENNARVGAQIAVEYSKLQQSEDVDAKHGRSHKGISLNTSSEQSPLAVVGCAAVDITAQQSHPARLHTTVPGRLSLQMGGVARNIAHAATLLLRRSGVTPPTLIAPVATDEWSQIVKDRMKLYDMRTDGLVTVHGGRTPTCTLVLDQEGGLMTGMADMNLVENWDECDIIASLERLGGLQIVCLDGNLMLKHFQKWFLGAANTT
ncbi:hypothetical protein BT69DRAFT_180546 [Atractiella rhizophila]|nr:hypothetical protein BT69DRAFT_180546 [Atractiella rhizophila]